MPSSSARDTMDLYGIWAGSSTYWVLNVAVPSIKGGSTEEMGGRMGAGEPVDPIWTFFG